MQAGTVWAAIVCMKAAWRPCISQTLPSSLTQQSVEAESPLCLSVPVPVPATQIECHLEHPAPCAQGVGGDTSALQYVMTKDDLRGRCAKYHAHCMHARMNTPARLRACLVAMAGIVLGLPGSRECDRLPQRSHYTHMLADRMHS